MSPLFPRLTYLDHAATSYPKPPQVGAAMAEAMVSCGGNPGRGSHRLALAAAEELYRCREVAARLFGAADPTRVVFTLNATHALNLAIKGLLDRGGGHAVCSDLEHNAVLRPLWRLREEGKISLSVYPTLATDPHRTDEMVLAAFEASLRPDTVLAVATQASNICSVSLPIQGMGAICRRRGIPFVVDASQSAGAMDIRVERDGISALCLPGHKGLLGPQGTGLLILGSQPGGCVRLGTLMEGGNGMDSLLPTMSEEAPERYEAGTVATPAIAGLRAGMEYVEAVGPAAIREHECRLADRLRERLLAIPGVTVYAPAARGAVVLFSLAGMDSEAVADALDGRGICTRPGFHCTALGHRTLGTPAAGAVRASVGWMTGLGDVEAAAAAVAELSRSPFGP